MNCFFFFKRHAKMKNKKNREEEEEEIVKQKKSYVRQAVGPDSSHRDSPNDNLSLISSRELRVFTFAELKTATKDFNRTCNIGEGGFGCVFRGTVEKSEDSNLKIDVAVKQLNKTGLQGHREWITEVRFLGIANHPNLVKLVGYCAEDDKRGAERLLVYEYMPNRSVLDHLPPQSNSPLSWPMRLKIALGSASGLTYLHEEMKFQIIFRDFKTSNILLDDHWNAKLSDFGLAREGPPADKSHVSTAVMGTLGYAAPEYIRTGHLTVKSDVWSYGMVLYELITGRRPFEPSLPKGQQKILEWMRPCISDINKFPRILDPHLVCDPCFSMKSALRLAAVANRCTHGDPRRRPTMSEVFGMVREIVQTTEMESRVNGSSSVPTEEVSDRRRERKGRSS